MVKIKSGDIFTISLGPGIFCVGQVIETSKHKSLVCIFRSIVSGEEIDESLADIPCALVGGVLDNKLRNGAWKIVGQREVDPSVPIPAFKTPSAPYFVEDFLENRLRAATPDEVTVIPNHSFVTPAFLEDAAKGALGLIEWHPLFESLRPPRTEATIAFLLYPDIR